MAENSDLRDPDNSWVIAGSEGLPVETVGPALGAATQTPADEEPAGHALPKGRGPEDAHTGRKSEGSQLSPSPDPEEAEFKDSEECPRETPSPAASPRPGAPGCEAPEIQAREGPGSEDPELGPGTETPGSGPTGRAGESPEDWSSSSEDDAEGQRRAPCGPAEHRGAEAAGDGQSGLSGNWCLLGVLALLGAGLLAFSGAIYDPGDGPMESLDPRDLPDGEQPPLAAGVKDWLQQPPLDPAGDPQSLHSMSLLLDKLAKENQDIRLLQAELQAQKDELQALLQTSEGEKASVGSQQQSLAGENARLHQALQQAVEAQRSAQAELQVLREQVLREQVLREQLQGLAREGAAETPRPREGLAAERPPEEQLLHRELAERRGLLGSVRRELAEALQRAPGAGGTEQLRVELAGVEQRLAQELQRAESWEQNYGEGRDRGATEPSRPPRQEPPKAAKKAGGGHKRQEAGEERRRRHGDPGGREQEGAKHPKRREQPDPARRQGPRDTKPAKDQNGQRRAGGGKGALGGPHEHSGVWEPPRLQRYRAPQGCAGVADCARQEGRELFGAELAPVQKGPFLQLLQGYMAGLGWGQHYAGLAARLDGAFAGDGTFAHDRLRFRHFVEDVEELLEELAEREQGDEEAADDFEEYVLRHYGGDGFTQKERERRRAKHQSKELREHGPPRARDGHRGKENSPPDQG